MVISIIMLVAGVVAINSQKALKDQRFQTEAMNFVDRLRLAQNLMLIGNADVHFKIEANEAEKSIKYWIETDRPFPKSFDNYIKKVSVLKTIHHVAHPQGKDGLIDLKFLSGGSSMTSGNIQLSCGNIHDPANPYVAYITLNGYPSPIFSTTKKPVEVQDFSNKDRELSQATIQEIRAINYAKTTAP
jgi:hypothetical protein